MIYWWHQKKREYLRIQAEYVETFYNNDKVDPYTREIMRRNSIWVMSNSKRGIAVDNVNEIYNYYLKTPVPTTSLGTTCERSRHVITGRRCNNDLWGVQEVNPSRARNKAAVFNAVERTEIVLHRSGVFASHAPETMNTDKFWKNVVRPRVSGTDTDRRNESCQLSPHEQNTMATINTIDNMQTAAETNDTDNNDDESVESSSVASRRTLSSVQNEPDDYNPLDNEDVHGDTEEDRNVFDAVDYLKHLGKMKKIPFSKSSLDDISELMVDRAEAYIKKQRDKFSMDTERNADIIEMSIRNYGEMMTRRRERIASLIAEDNRVHIQEVTDYQREYDRLLNRAT